MLYSFTLLLLCSVLSNLALNYQKSGRVDSAIATYEQVVEMQTGDPGIPLLSLSTCMYGTLSVLKYQLICTNLLL